jgi:hypothetical protein
MRRHTGGCIATTDRAQEQETMATLKGFVTRHTNHTSTLPSTVEQHPDYRRYVEQREALVRQVETAQGDLSRISAERDQLQATRQDL